MTRFCEMMMYQHRSINCNKCTLLGWDIGWDVDGGEELKEWELCTSPQTAVNLKLLKKNKVFFKVRIYNNKYTVSC